MSNHPRAFRCLSQSGVRGIPARVFAPARGGRVPDSERGECADSGMEKAGAPCTPACFVCCGPIGPGLI